eukprot:GHVS01048947.1.p2 GENE.GHVS01048947.1~~GHVS01048947.1.p2  ORF type:complete len:135 (-),score=7.61 GHVS01048947.1:609-1013(-)
MSVFFCMLLSARDNFSSKLEILVSNCCTLFDTVVSRLRIFSCCCKDIRKFSSVEMEDKSVTSTGFSSFWLVTMLPLSLRSLQATFEQTPQDSSTLVCHMCLPEMTVSSPWSFPKSTFIFNVSIDWFGSKKKVQW